MPSMALRLQRISSPASHLVPSRFRSVSPAFSLASSPVACPSAFCAFSRSPASSSPASSSSASSSPPLPFSLPLSAARSPPRPRLRAPSLPRPRRPYTTPPPPTPPTTMDFDACVERLRSGAAVKFPPDANSLAFAQHMDGQDKLRHLRDEFILPTKSSLKKRALDGTLPSEHPPSARAHTRRGTRPLTRPPSPVHRDRRHQWRRHARRRRRAVPLLCWQLTRRPAQGSEAPH